MLDFVCWCRLCALCIVIVFSTRFKIRLMASSQLVFCFSVLDTKIQNKVELVTSDDAMRTPMRKRRSKNDILKGFYLQLIGKVQK